MHSKYWLTNSALKEKSILYKFDIFMFNVSSSRPLHYGKRSMNTIENNNRAITTHHNTHIGKNCNMTYGFHSRMGGFPVVHIWITV